MSTPLTKAQLRQALGFTTDAQLIEWFAPITASAISQWGEHEPIPERRWLFAQLKRPDLFNGSAAAGKCEAA